MHTYLLNLGFIKRPDGTYYNNELGISLRVLDDTFVEVDTPAGPIKSNLPELEDAIISGGFGEF